MELVNKNGRKKLEEAQSRLEKDVNFVLQRISEKKDRLMHLGVRISAIDGLIYGRPADILFSLNNPVYEGIRVEHVPPTIPFPSLIYITDRYLEAQETARHKIIAHELAHSLIGKKRHGEYETLFGARQAEHICDTIADVVVPEISLRDAIFELRKKELPPFPSDTLAQFFQDARYIWQDHPSTALRARMSEGRLSGEPAFYYYNALTDAAAAALSCIGMKDLAIAISRWRVPDRLPD